MNILYVYGTLRPPKEATIDIVGSLHRVSWFPGVSLGGSRTFKACRIEVSDDRLMQLDRYEGYDPSSPETSLFLRVPCLDGEIYTYNGDTSEHPVIESGDWYEKGEHLWA